MPSCLFKKAIFLQGCPQEAIDSQRCWEERSRCGWKATCVHRGSRANLVWRCGFPSVLRLSSFLPGAKHRWMAEGHQGAPRRGRGRPVSRGGTGHKTKRVMGNRGGRQGPSPPFHCALCQLHVNSETQLKQVGEGEARIGWALEQGRKDGCPLRHGCGKLAQNCPTLRAPLCIEHESHG